MRTNDGTEDQIIAEGDRNYLAVAPLNEASDGLVCFIEVGKRLEALDDRHALLLPLNKEGAEAMLLALSNALGQGGAT